MPELPEVETVRRGIAPHLIGQQVVRVVVRQPRLRWPVPDEFGKRSGATGGAVPGDFACRTDEQRLANLVVPPSATLS